MMTEPAHLNNQHRDTVAKILQHPASHNVEWHAVLSLLQYIGQVDERHDGRFKVTIGGETEIFDKPKHKNIDEQQVVDLRRMLGAAGYVVDGGREN
jgi:thiamine biosynthesis lipoprotein ApbE